MDLKENARIVQTIRLMDWMTVRVPGRGIPQAVRLVAREKFFEGRIVCIRSLPDGRTSLSFK